MKIAVRYYTRSGNTKKLADAIAKAVGVKAQSISVPLDEKVDVLFLGNSYYAFDIDEAVKVFIKENKDNIGKIANFSTAAGMGSTVKQVKKVADECGVKLMDEVFHCRGSFGPFNKGKPDSKDTAAAAEFAKKITG